MRCFPQWAGTIVLLAAAVVARADDPKAKAPPQKEETPKTAAEQYQALVKEFTAARDDYMKAARDAKTPEERQKIFEEKYPKPQDYAKKFMAIAEKYPHDPVAVDALVWVTGNAPNGPEAKVAIETLLKDHIKSDKLGPLCARLAYAPDGETALRKILAESPDKNVQGQACYGLAQALKRSADHGNEDAGKEAEKLFDQIVEKYASVKVGNRELGKIAKGELNEIRLLSVGKVAPEIDGEDIDGKKFKLSDYRGKVVMIDFWGHW